MADKTTKQMFAGKDFVLELNYSKKASKDRLIRFTPQNGTPFEVGADALCNFVFEKFNQKELGLALSQVGVDTIQIVEAQKQVVFKAEEDIPKGKEVLVTFKQWLPYVFATIENIAAGLDKQDMLVKGLPKEELDKHFYALKENNIEFFEKLTQKTYPELDKIKDKK